MASPYSSKTIVNYNLNAPPDDGTRVAANEGRWSYVKEKLVDPVKTLVEAINTALLTSFTKVFGGATPSSQSGDYTIQESDQGGTIIYTGTGTHTHTTPDATIVGTPWVCSFTNAGTGAYTLDGSGAQTINGAASLNVRPGEGGVLISDGTNFSAIFQNKGGWQVIDSDTETSSTSLEIDHALLADYELIEFQIDVTILSAATVISLELYASAYGADYDYTSVWSGHNVSAFALSGSQSAKVQIIPSAETTNDPIHFVAQVRSNTGDFPFIHNSRGFYINPSAPSFGNVFLSSGSATANDITGRVTKLRITANNAITFDWKVRGYNELT